MWRSLHPPLTHPFKESVTIEGSTLIEGFISWEITFGYASDSTGTWFLIAEGDEQVSSGELTQWDTTTITDADYNLRLTVYMEGGRREHFVLNNLRVRNYSPIETITPTPYVDIHTLHRNTPPQPDSHQHNPTNRYPHPQYTHPTAHQSGHDHPERNQQQPDSAARPGRWQPSYWLDYICP